VSILPGGVRVEGSQGAREIREIDARYQPNGDVVPAFSRISSPPCNIFSECESSCSA
jgi:hypothetical protein